MASIRKAGTARFPLRGDVTLEDHTPNGQQYIQHNNRACPSQRNGISAHAKAKLVVNLVVPEVYSSSDSRFSQEYHLILDNIDHEANGNNPVNKHKCSKKASLASER